MKQNMVNEFLLSESKREGLKHITRSVYKLVSSSEDCTYDFLCSKIQVKNKNTLKRRIYDVLSVMRALKMVIKRNKAYVVAEPELQNSAHNRLKAKKEEIKNLEEMKKVFSYLIERNMYNNSIELERLYLPFMVVTTKKDAEVHCETNEERSFFKFRSNKPMFLTEDLGILKEIYGSKENDYMFSSEADLMRSDNYTEECLCRGDEVLNDVYNFIV